MIQQLRESIGRVLIEAQGMGWRWVIAERTLGRLGFDDAKLAPAGLNRGVFCRFATADIREYHHLLGPQRQNFDLPLRPKIIVDAGANVGYSVLRFRLEYPDAFIVAIEPESSNFSQLQKNCAGDYNIVLEQKALWSTQARLAIQSFDIDKNAFRVGGHDSGDILAISVPDILTMHKLETIDLLKIDIEGSETEVFRHHSTEEWLPRVSMILIETHDGIAPGCSKIVADALAGLFDRSEDCGEYSLYVRRQAA
jgi:FkbM family methyltransferase